MYDGITAIKIISPFSEIKDIELFKTWLSDALNIMYRRGYVDGLYMLSVSVGAAINEHLEEENPGGFILGMVIDDICKRKCGDHELEGGA